jgi:predicted DNA-binding protein with PD1-like motif
MTTPEDFGTDGELVIMGRGDVMKVHMAYPDDQRELAVGPEEPVIEIFRLDGTVERYAASRTQFHVHAGTGRE